MTYSNKSIVLIFNKIKKGVLVLNTYLTGTDQAEPNRLTDFEKKSL